MSVHNLLKLIVRGGAVLLVGTSLVGCVTTPSDSEKQTKGGPLKLTPPKMRSDQDEKVVREHWVTMKLPEGMVFAQAKDGMDDVISMSAQESAAGSAVKSLDDVDVIISAGGAKFLKKRRTEVLGEACIRYERVTEAPEESLAVRQQLRAHGRSMPGPFMNRTLGAIFLHPHKPGCYVTLTCVRTSYHGEIGDYYEELFDDFVQAFVPDNCLKPEAYQPL